MTLIERIEEAKSRINKINFLKPVTVGYAQSIIPELQEKLNKNRKELCKLREENPVQMRIKKNPRGEILKKIQGEPDEEKFDYRIIDKLYYPFEELKKKVYRKGIYGIVAHASKECILTLIQKINPILEDIIEDRSRHGTGGSLVWENSYQEKNHVDEIADILKKDISAYIWNEGARAENEKNLYDILMQFYELQVIPLGFKEINFRNKDGNYGERNQEFIIEIPLNKNQAKSNIARGDYIENLSTLIKERRGGFAILNKAETMGSYTLAAYVDGDNKIKYVRYWSEGYYGLRPLVIE